MADLSTRSSTHTPECPSRMLQTLHHQALNQHSLLKLTPPLYKDALDSTDRSHIPLIWPSHDDSVYTFCYVHFDSVRVLTIIALFQRRRFGASLFSHQRICIHILASCLIFLPLQRYHTTHMFHSILVYFPSRVFVSFLALHYSNKA